MFWLTDDGSLPALSSSYESTVVGDAALFPSEEIEQSSNMFSSPVHGSFVASSITSRSGLLSAFWPSSAGND